MSLTRLQSLATRPADQRAPSHSDEEVSLKRLPAYYFLATIISCNTQAQTSCLQPCTKGAAKDTLPRFTAACWVCRANKKGDRTTRRSLCRALGSSLHLVPDETGASERAAAKTAAAAKQKSSQKHTELKLCGINRMGPCWHHSWKLKTQRAQAHHASLFSEQKTMAAE